MYTCTCTCLQTSFLFVLQTLTEPCQWLERIGQGVRDVLQSSIGRWTYSIQLVHSHIIILTCNASRVRTNMCMYMHAWVCILPWASKWPRTNYSSLGLPTLSDHYRHSQIGPCMIIFQAFPSLVCIVQAMMHCKVNEHLVMHRVPVHQRNVI